MEITVLNEYRKKFTETTEKTLIKSAYAELVDDILTLTVVVKNEKVKFDEICTLGQGMRFTDRTSVELVFRKHNLYSAVIFDSESDEERQLMDDPIYMWSNENTFVFKCLSPYGTKNKLLAEWQAM